ncbi:MAG: GAF domain-containing sensor histidine kinase [Armatimonadota bacterium]|nr:GAF domain-containing sensor histidine kinase [Armatimonadota bacterium]
MQGENPSVRSLWKEFLPHQTGKFRTVPPQLGHRGHLFVYILIYRWFSLVPPLLAMLPGLHPGYWSLRWIFSLAAGYNAAITLFHPWLNQIAVQHPLLVGVDILFCVALIHLSGGVTTPYYLYALSPLFAAGLFFRVRGGLLAASGMSLSYGVVMAANALVLGKDMNPALMSIHIAGFFLIAGLFANFTSLLEDQRANAHLLEQIRNELVRKTAELQRMNRHLLSLHGLAVALQSAAVDVHDVQRRVLTSLTEELGYPRAFMGLVDHGDRSLTGWMGASRGSLEEEIPPTLRVPIMEDQGPLAQALQSRAPYVIRDGTTIFAHPVFPTNSLRRGVVIPLLVRDLPVGVLVVEVPDGEPPDKEALALLNSVAHQAALAIWSTRMCVERAQRSAIQEERNRIAREIHDTVSQCLFGTVYTLESCLKLIPEDLRAVRERLESVLRLSTKTMGEIRGLIFDMWIGGMTTSEFISELKSYLQDIGKPETLEVEISVQGDLTELTPFTRKHLFRIAQEALANVVRHARATQATVHLTADSQTIQLVIRDNGTGFDLGRTPAGIGLSGMRERALAIGGSLTVRSAQGQGTTVEVKLPRLACVSNPSFVS